MRFFLFIAVVIPFIASAASEYKRSDWRWIDADNDCQDTRHELLIQESKIPVTFKPSSKGPECLVSTGQWYGPYLGKFFTKARDLDVDHVVPAKWVYDHGAADWSKEQIREFSNDTTNLLLVDKSENRSKGAKGPSEYMPPNADFHCPYLAKWVVVTNKYNLTPGLDDQRKIASGLSSCSDFQLASTPETKAIPNRSTIIVKQTPDGRSKPVEPISITFHSYTENGVAKFSNIPHKCVVEGVLICTGLHPIFSH